MSSTSAISLHSEVIRRLMKHQENLPHGDGMSFSTIFMKDFVFARGELTGRPPRHSRWRIVKGSLVPFHASEDELNDIVQYLFTVGNLDEEMIALALDRPYNEVKARLNHIAHAETEAFVS